MEVNLKMKRLLSAKGCLYDNTKIHTSLSYKSQLDLGCFLWKLLKKY